MWGTDHLVRARRRLAGVPRHEVLVAGATARSGTEPPPAAEQPPPRPLGELRLALTGAERDAFVAALAMTLDPTTPRLDSPARLADAVQHAIVRVAGSGRPTVTRSPAGLYTPEYWHIRIEAADGAARAELERLAGGRRID